MKDRTRLLALVGLVGSLGLVWAVSAGMMWSAASAPAAARDAKFASAERLVFFRLEPGEALQLPLPRNADAFRLLTHLVLPPGTAYAPEHQYVYGTQVRLLAEDGAVVLEHPLFTRTRQSKGQRLEGMWLQESAFSVNPEVQLTDGREFLVDLSPAVRERARRLEVRHPGTQGALLVRAYARFEGRPSLLARSAPRRAAARAERATFLPWEKLPVETGGPLPQEHWERLSADGEAGLDFRTEPVYRTDFRLPLVEVEEAAQERLAPGRSVALNVAGPAALQLWLWVQEPLPPGAPQPAVSVQALGADGSARTWDVRVPPGLEPTSHPLQLPAGTFTVTLHNAGKHPLRFTVEGPPSMWLAPPELLAARDGLRVAYLPDVRRMEAWATGPGCPALELDVQDMDAAGRLLGLVARGLGPTARGGQLSLTLLDARGRTLTTAQLPLSADAAPLDGVDLPALRDGQVPCAASSPAGSGGAGTASLVEVMDQLLPVSQPASARVLLPAGTHRVRLTSSRPAALLLASFLGGPGDVRPMPPYGDVALADVHWRTAPLERRHWHALRPVNHSALTSLGARLALVAQVRLEPNFPPRRSPPPSGEAVTLQPDGTPASRELLEPVVGEADATRTRLSLLTPGEPLRVEFDARTPTRPELRLLLEGEEGLGREMELLVDGTPVRRWVVRSTRTRELLPPVAPGVREVLLRTSSPALTATLNRPPAGGQGLVPRTVYRLERGGLRVPVRKPGTGPVTLNVVLYAPTREATVDPRLSVRIDGGTPERRGGIFLSRLTRAERTLPLPASDRPAAFQAAAPREGWHARTVPVRLGEDLTPGVHWVELQPVGEGPLWARFFVYTEEAQDEGPLQWNRAGWEPEDTP